MNSGQHCYRLLRQLGLAGALLGLLAATSLAAQEIENAPDGEPVSIEAADIVVRGIAYDTSNTRGPKPAIIHLHERRENGVRAGALETYYARHSSSRGFYSVAVTMRGWPDTGGIDDCGLQQPHDISQVVDWLAEQPGVDPSRIAIIGTAQGGQVALLTAAMNPKVRVVAALNPLTDVTRWSTETDLSPYMVDSYINGVCTYPGTKADRSPLFIADRINASVALFHGDRDRRIPLWHSEAMHIALLGSGKSSKLVVVEGGPHDIGHPIWGGDTAAIDQALDFIEDSWHPTTPPLKLSRQRLR